MKAWKQVAGSLVIGSALMLPLPAHSAPQHHPHGQAQEKTVKDPVCGMNVLPSKSEKATYKKKTYYFCSAAEKTQFEKDPAKFLAKPRG